MKTDNLFYRIFKVLPSLALELAGVTVANPAGYGFRAEEVKQTAFRLDGLLIPPAKYRTKTSKPRGNPGISR